MGPNGLSSKVLLAFGQIGAAESTTEGRRATRKRTMETLFVPLPAPVIVTRSVHILPYSLGGADDCTRNTAQEGMEDGAGRRRQNTLSLIVGKHANPYELRYQCLCSRKATIDSLFVFGM